MVVKYFLSTVCLRLSLQFFLLHNLGYVIMLLQNTSQLKITVTVDTFRQSEYSIWFTHMNYQLVLI